MNRYILKGTVNEISSEPAFIYKNYLRISCFRSNGIGPFKLKKTTLFIGLRYQRYRQESGMPFLLKWRVTKKYIDSPFQSRYPEFISLSFLHNISHLTKIFKFQSTLLSSSPSSLPQDLKMTFMRLTYPIHSPPYPTTTFCFILTYPIHSPPYPTTTYCFILTYPIHSPPYPTIPSVLFLLSAFFLLSYNFTIFHLQSFSFSLKFILFQANYLERIIR